MQFEIPTPSFLGDVVFLSSIAEAMANAKATAFGTTDFHEPAYEGAFKRISKTLLHDAKNGVLRICDQDGAPTTVTAAVEQAKRDGVFISIMTHAVAPDWEAIKLSHPEIVTSSGILDLTSIDLGASEIDVEASELNCLLTKMHFLNEWGATRGDTFSIAKDAPQWIDERGVMGQAAITDREGTNSRPIPMHRHQENEILRVIAELGYNAKALPKDKAGKPGVKAEVRSKLKFSSVVFNKAWERLRQMKDIRNIR